MKRMCQGSVCLTWIRAAAAAALVLPTLSSCKQEKWNEERVPLLTAPGVAEVDGYLAVLEEFKDTCIFEAVAFDQYGVGYGVIGTHSSSGDYDPYKSVLLMTVDGGRTWQPTGKRMRGRCSEMRLLDDNLYLLMHKRRPRMSAILKYDTENRSKLKLLSRFGAQTDVHKLHVLNDSTFACGMRFSKRSEDGQVSSSDSVMVSTDSGRTWEAVSLPEMHRGLPNLAFDGDHFFLTFSDGEGGWHLFAKNIMTGEEKRFPLPGYFSGIVASDNLIAASPMSAFWQYKGSGIQRKPGFGWNPGHGTYYPKYLHKKGNLVICIGEQLIGSIGKTYCVFVSVDGGRHWRAALMGDDICGPMATTGGCWHADMSSRSVSVFFTCKGDIRRGYKHCILTLGERMDPAQELYDLIFAPLIEYYKENVPGFNLSDVF